MRAFDGTRKKRFYDDGADGCHSHCFRHGFAGYTKFCHVHRQYAAQGCSRRSLFHPAANPGKCHPKRRKVDDPVYVDLVSDIRLQRQCLQRRQRYSDEGESLFQIRRNIVHGHLLEPSNGIPIGRHGVTGRIDNDQQQQRKITNHYRPVVWKYQNVKLLREKP